MHVLLTKAELYMLLSCTKYQENCSWVDENSVQINLKIHSYKTKRNSRCAIHFKPYV